MVRMMWSLGLSVFQGILNDRTCPQLNYTQCGSCRIIIIWTHCNIPLNYFMQFICRLAVFCCSFLSSLNGSESFAIYLLHTHFLGQWCGPPFAPALLYHTFLVIVISDGNCNTLIHYWQIEATSIAYNNNNCSLIR